MNPSSEMSPPSADDLKKLYNTYGVNCVPFSLADPPQVTNIWTASSGLFSGTTWNVKPLPVRFIPPLPIPIQKAIPQTNSDGGKVVAPSLTPQPESTYPPTV
jgi:hypothetical protein